MPNIPESCQLIAGQQTACVYISLWKSISWR